MDYVGALCGDVNYCYDRGIAVWLAGEGLWESVWLFLLATSNIGGVTSHDI